MNVMNGSAPTCYEHFSKGEHPCPAATTSQPGCDPELDELLLRVGLAEPKRRQTSPLLFGLGAGGALNGLLLGYLAIRYFFFPFYGGFGGSSRSMPEGGGSIHRGSASCSVRWKVRRLSLLGKWAVVISCWGLTIADLIIFSTTVR